MSTLSPHFRHLARIDAATAACRRELEATDGLEADHNTVKRLTKAILREIEGLVETITDERIGDTYDGVLDEISICFMDAIDKRDDRRSPESRKIYAAEAAGRM
jgi:hypothetical protein